MLESLQQTNIGRLNLPEPGLTKNNALFDPERDISLEGWRKMKIFLWDETGFKFTDTAGKMRFLFPDRENELHINDWGAVRNLLNSRIVDFDRSPNEARLRDLRRDLARCVIAYPKKTPLIRDLYGYLWTRAQNNPGIPTGFDISALEDLAILAPKQNRPTDVLIKWKQMQLDSIKKRFPYKEGSYFLAVDVGQFKLIFPDFDLNIPQNFWEVGKGLPFNFKLDSNSGRSLMEMSISVAFYLKILAAEEIKVTDNGLEVVMPNPQAELNLVTPDLPETRKF